jgi:hypothetical protein
MATGYQSSDGDVQRDGPASSGGDPGQVKSVGIRHWNEIIARFLALIRSHVPLGYEDETGFHVGIMSPEK